jgi:(2Fe-2S) ferredoxin
MSRERQSPPPATEPRRPDAVVLLGRGGYGEWPQQELDRMVAAVRATGRYAQVVGAFIDQGAPGLLEALQACVVAGARRILIAPVFVPVDRTLRLWIPMVVRRWLRRRLARNAAGVEIVLADALGDHPALGQAVAQAVQDAEGRADVSAGAPAHGDPASPGWSVIPPHRYHVLLCAGPRCATQGSLELWQRLRDRLTARGLTTGKDRVLLVRTACLYPCNLGPVMVVYPEGTWYCALTARAIDRLVDEQFVRGQVVDAYARRPGRRRHTRPQPDADDPEEVALRAAAAVGIAQGP